jgi:hypothetical protein
MSYQERIIEFGEKIFNCPHYKKDGVCQSELADVSGGQYKHGPEICFVGDRYGQGGFPRILFSRLNPTWNSTIGWFGELESVTEYRMNHPNADTGDIFRCYLKGWRHGHKIFLGMWDAGTVTGHPNRSLRPSEEKRMYPRYGIQAIMEEMIRAGVFPQPYESPLEFCAINNVVKCAGSLKNWKPSTSMYRKCNYYEKELDILEPHILVTFGNDTNHYLRSKLKDRFFNVGNQNMLSLSDATKCLYFLFPHPLGQGKITWRGDKVRHFCPDSSIDRDPGPKEKETFEAWPCGMILFKYILYLVSETKKLMAKGEGNIQSLTLWNDLV